MAREESDREDLLREATALVRRIELRVPHEAESVVCGFRRDGAASFFFGADPVYQFNARGELRRAYDNGLLLKAEGCKLAALRRVRTEAEVQLIRRDLDAAETQTLMTAMTARLSALHTALSGEFITVVGQVPPDGDLLPAVRAELQRLIASPQIAATPRAGA